jgi:hypothetical protein
VPQKSTGAAMESAGALLPQVLGAPQDARLEFGMVSDNIDKAPQKGVTHIPTADLYPVTAVAL